MISAADDRTSDGALGGIVVERDARILEEARERCQFATVYADAFPIDSDFSGACTQSQVFSCSRISTDSVRRSSAMRSRSPAARSSIS